MLLGPTALVRKEILMHSIVTRTAFLVLLCLPCVPADAQELPRFDVQATCRAAPALTPQDGNPYEGCMRDELAAEGRLRAKWSGASANARRECAQETQIGGSPSYVDVLTCLEMYGTDPSSDAPRRRARPRQ